MGTFYTFHVRGNGPWANLRAVAVDRYKWSEDVGLLLRLNPEKNYRFTSSVVNKDKDRDLLAGKSLYSGVWPKYALQFHSSLMGNEAKNPAFLEYRLLP